MTTPSASGLDLAGAIATIDRATAFDVPLRRRTEGVTWIVWGLVTLLVMALQPHLMGLPSWQPSYIGIAIWPFAGLVAISAVWRIGALSTPALAPDPARVVRAAVGASVAVVALGMLVWFGYAWTGSYALAAGVFTLFPWGLVNAVQWRRMTEPGRRIAVGAGIVMAIGGFVVALSWPAVPSAPDMLLYGAIVGGGPFALGLYRALTG